LISDTFFDHLNIIFDKLEQNEIEDNWFYIRLFHTEFWSGWAMNVTSHWICYILIFLIPIFIIHNCYRYKISKLNVNKLINCHKLVLLLLLLLLYLIFSSSLLWFIHGIGKQNIDYFIFKYVSKWNDFNQMNGSSKSI